MTFESPFPQECYFYEGRWNEEIVGVFIRTLKDDLLCGVWDLGDDNRRGLIAAQQYVNLMHDKDYSWAEVVGLVDVLKKRYKTFKHVLDTDGVRWDRRYNHVHATADVWDNLFKWDEFTKAFYHRGDAMYEDLKTLFGTEGAVPPVTVVISSDGPLPNEPNTAERPIIIPDSPNPEVTSPILHGRNGAPRKKLFNESLGGNEAAASSEESRCEILRMKVAKAKAKTERILARLKNRHCETSSCASSSPIKAVPSPPATD